MSSGSEPGSIRSVRTLLSAPTARPTRAGGRDTNRGDRA